MASPFSSAVCLRCCSTDQQTTSVKSIYFCVEFELRRTWIILFVWPPCHLTSPPSFFFHVHALKGKKVKCSCGFKTAVRLILFYNLIYIPEKPPTVRLAFHEVEDNILLLQLLNCKGLSRWYILESNFVRRIRDEETLDVILWIKFVESWKQSNLYIPVRFAGLV
jgi:hypothetical protein